jgi:hypothetical protein
LLTVSLLFLSFCGLERKRDASATLMRARGYVASFVDDLVDADGSINWRVAVAMNSMFRRDGFEVEV